MSKALEVLDAAIKEKTDILTTVSARVFDIALNPTDRAAYIEAGLVLRSVGEVLTEIRERVATAEATEEVAEEPAAEEETTK